MKGSRMSWDWAVYAAGIATASLVWGIFWAVFTRKTEPKHAIKTAKEIERTKREVDGIRELRSGALNVLQMAEGLLQAYRTNPGSVSVGHVSVKMTGRLRGLRESWLRYGDDIREKSVIEAYERLAMERTIGRFAEADSHINNAVERLVSVRDKANELRAEAESVLH